MTHDTLIHSQQEGSLTINVREDKAHRWLDFGDGAIQSIIDLQRSHTLVSPLHQATMAGLIFLPTPQNMLLLGLGGGAIARFMAHHQPSCKGFAVEVSPAVANLARKYFDFPQGWGLHIGSAREYLADGYEPNKYGDINRQVDYLLVDIAQQTHTPDWICSAPFLTQCRQKLSACGVVVFNLVPHNTDELTRQLTAIRKVFSARTLCLSIPCHHNVLVFGFAQRPIFESNAELQSRIAALTQQWPLPFDTFLKQMIHDNPEGSGVF